MSLLQSMTYFHEGIGKKRKKKMPIGPGQCWFLTYVGFGVLHTRFSQRSRAQDGSGNMERRTLDLSLSYVLCCSGGRSKSRKRGMAVLGHSKVLTFPDVWKLFGFWLLFGRGGVLNNCICHSHSRFFIAFWIHYYWYCRLRHFPRWHFFTHDNILREFIFLLPAFIYMLIEQIIISSRWNTLQKSIH